MTSLIQRPSDDSGPLSLFVKDALEDVLSIELACGLARSTLLHLNRVLRAETSPLRVTLHYMDRRTLMLSAACSGTQWQLIKSALRDLPQVTVTNSPMRTAGSDLLIGNLNEPHVWLTWQSESARR